MKHIILNLLFLSISLLTYSQESLKFSFESVSLEKALDEIENATSYKFYYQKEWVLNEVVTGTFEGNDINELLDSFFSKTPLNYTLLNNKIILTKGNFIFKELPDNFFNNEESEKPSELVTPILQKNSFLSDSKKSETVVIGKENAMMIADTYTLSGIITNQKTGEPLSQSTINVEGTSVYTTTNQEGYYSLSLKRGLNTIKIQALGMETLKVEVLIYSSGNLNLLMNEGMELLDEILLKSNAQANVRQTLSGISKIEVEQIKNIPLVLGERDILKVATTLPGISTAGEASLGYNIRGGKTDQNLFLLDGGVIYNPSHFFGIFSAINPFTTAKAEIYKGSIPARFGGRLSSVIEMTTKDASTDKFKGEVSIGPVTGNITLETPLIKDKAGLMVGARGSYSDWILKTLDDETLNNTTASFYDVIVKYNHKINEKNKLMMTGYHSNDVFNITIDSLYSYSNSLASLSWAHKYNDKTNGNLSLAYSQYKYGIDFDKQTTGDFEFGFDLNETEIKYDFNTQINTSHRLEMGISSKLYSINPGEVNPLGQTSEIETFSVDKEQGLESALYISDEWKLTEELSIDAGLRYSMFNLLGENSQRTYIPGQPLNNSTVLDTVHYDKNELVETHSGLEIRASARYLLSPSLSLKASYNNTLQYIHTLSNNTTASPLDTWKLSDTHIKPQRGQQYSLGVFKNIKNNLYELSIEGYYKKLNNILDYKVGGQLLLNEFVETEVLQGPGKSYGVEFLVKKNEGKLNGWLGYTYSRTLFKLASEFSEEQVNNGNYFPSNYDKPHDFSLVLNYKLTKRYSFSGNFVYQTGRPVTFPVGAFQEGGSQYVLYSDRNQFRIPDFYRLDIGFNMEGNHKIKKFAHSFWNISIYNVLGRNNPFSVFFVTEDGDIKAYQSSIFSVPVPTITYNFKF
tara:strand:+ start:86109 stop:88850 length:2742 start_codon:yes stop_codon:yes gene_type:complete